MMTGKRRYYWLLIILGLAWEQKTRTAQEINDLYQASIPVTGQGEEERTTAFRSALADVISRVSSRKIQLPSISAEELAVRYHYEPATNGLYFIVNFEPEAINRLVGKHEAIVWGKRRPSTLVWLTLQEQDGSNWIAGNNGPSPYQVPLQEQAQRRGVPLVWPIMDFLKNAELPLPGNNKKLIATLRDESRDYPVDAIWIGSLTSRPQKPSGSTTTAEGSKIWTVHWTLLRVNTEEQWNTSGAEPATALMAGVDKLAERLTIKIPSATGAALVQHPLVRVVVTEVVSLEYYAQLRVLIENLPEVLRIWPSHLDPEGRLTFAVEPKENSAVLATALSRTGVLFIDEPESSTDRPTREDSTLYYRKIKND
ncbi:conserved hypothetical protein [Gammaproteobacteria bacterium]